MTRFLVILLVCAGIGALVALGAHALLKDTQGFLAENRAAVVGGVTGAVCVLAVRMLWRPNSRKQA